MLMNREVDYLKLRKAILMKQSPQRPFKAAPPTRSTPKGPPPSGPKPPPKQPQPPPPPGAELILTFRTSATTTKGGATKAAPSGIAETITASQAKSH
eukprot:3347785-Amphidinium_carterae.3